MRHPWKNRDIRPFAAFAGLAVILACITWAADVQGQAVAQPGYTGTGNLSQLATAPPQSPVASVTESQPYTNQFAGEYYTNDLTEVFRVKHIEGDGQGDVPAYTHLGFTKFGWADNGVWLFDLAARITNEAEGGFTAGIHRRVILGGLMLGGGGFYDWQQEFQQGSIAFELFSDNWSFRTNGYFVLGDEVETESDYELTGTSTIFFQGNNILADNLLLVEDSQVALSGVDMEVARNFGTANELFVGGYFLAGELNQNTIGAKGGVRGFIVPDIAATLTVSGDDLFGVNVYGGVTWFVGARGGLSRPNMARRLIIPVERNEQVAVADVRNVEAVAGPIILTNEDDAIEVVHIDSTALGSANLGTFEDPYLALPPTVDADIVYVHADSVYDNQSYTLAEDQRLLGEGAGNLHLVETNELDEIILPAGNGGTARPIIQNTLGNAIIIGGGDSEVSNMEIQNALVNGIFADGVDGFDINRNVINLSGANGIFLNNVTGAADENLIATGEVSDNIVTNSGVHNIRIVLASDFDGEVTGNTASSAGAGNGIDIRGQFIFLGEIENNTTNSNAQNGILIDVAEFRGEISGNTANLNGNNGLFLTFGFFRGDIENNTTNGNALHGIDFIINGDFFTRAEFEGNTADGNGLEGIHMLFGGTGTSAISVLNNNLSNNNGGVNREFFAEVEDVYGNEPVVFIELDGNTSTNLTVPPAFNYEFDNTDNFADGEMYLDQGTNVGTVENDDDVEDEEFPFD